mgnify:CR=1 FL=1
MPLGLSLLTTGYMMIPPKIKQMGIYHVSLSLQTKRTIPFKQSIFSIDFVALNYTNTPKNQYAYKLENYDNNWHNACKGKVKNSVGAGDSMVAGFLAGLQGGDYEYALKLGTAAGGATAFSDGLAERQAIDALFEQL